MGEAAQQRLLARPVALPGRLRAGRALGGQNWHLWGPKECETSPSIMFVQLQDEHLGKLKVAFPSRFGKVAARCC